MGATKVCVIIGSAGAAFLGYFSIITKPSQSISWIVQVMAIPGQIANFMLKALGNNITGKGEALLAMAAWLTAWIIAGAVIDRQ